MINIKIIKKIGKIFFVIWAIYSLLMIFLVLMQDLVSVINGDVEIYNLYWFLGLIPSIFAVFYLVSKSFFRKSYLLMRTVGLLGLMTFLVTVFVQLAPGATEFVYQYAIVGLFGLFIALNSFIKHRKIETKQSEE